MSSAQPVLINRYTVEPKAAGACSPTGLKSFQKKDLVLVTGEAPGIIDCLIDAMKAEKLRVRRIIWGKAVESAGDGPIVVDPVSENTSDRIARIIRSSGDRVGAVINLAGFQHPGAPPNAGRNDVFGFFAVLKAIESDIRESAVQGGGLVVNVTPLGGRFGLNDLPRLASAEAAGTLGVAKTAALEWPHARVRCIDVDPAMGTETTAAMLWDEIRINASALEIGLDGKCRWEPVLQKSPSISRGLEMEGDSVVLLLGGGSGITFSIGKAMAQKCRPRMIIVGQTPLGEPESPETAGLFDRASLKTFFIRSARIHNLPATPAAIDQRINHVLKRRQLSNNIGSLKAAGARVEYHPMDARDESALGRLIDDIYRRFGRIDGVVHGAGIIDDRRIRDKSIASFCSVYDAKVAPAMVLAQKLAPDSLRFLVFFSSVAARFGNIGQCDYSGANEVLNKLALHLAGKWPRTRVKSMGWGPWDVGMVKDDLKKMYRQKGIGMICENAGADFFMNELGRGMDDAVEIVATAATPQILKNGLGR